MRRLKKSYWMGICTNSARREATVKSWFSPLCDQMTVESAEVLCDTETDREKKIMAVMVDEDGKRHIAVRTKGQRFSISLKPA